MMELQVIDKKEIATLTSLELVDLINKFRKEEGNKTLKRHDVLLRDIRNELKTLEQFGINNAHNFVEVVYTDSKGESRPCYQMNKAGTMQMLNKESALVRYKTQQYIETLENKLKEISKPLGTMELLKLQYKALEEQDKKIEEVDKKVDQRFDDLPLFPSDSKVLKKLANQTVVPLLGGKKSNAYKKLSRKVFSDLYKQIHREFDVVGCEEIKRKDLEFAKGIIYNYKLPRALEEEIKLLNSQVAFA